MTVPLFLQPHVRFFHNALPPRGEQRRQASMSPLSCSLSVLWRGALTKQWVLKALVAAVPAALTGVLAVLYALWEPPHIDLGEGASLAFEAENMLPGESRTCEYTLKGEEGYLGISFEEGDEDGLAPFLHVKVEADGETLYSGSLADAGGLWTDFDGEALLKVEYSLPLDTGNEAQQLEALVYLTLTLTDVPPAEGGEIST